MCFSLVELGFIGIRGIGDGEMVELCKLAESVIRNYLFTRIPRRQVLDLDVTVEANLNDVLTITIDLDVTLSPFFRGNLEEIEDEAINEAFNAIEKKLRELSNLDRR